MTNTPTDHTGRTFGQLTALTYNPDTKRWLCRCSCGVDKEVMTYSLTSGATQSCGCLRRQVVGDLKRKHGMRRQADGTMSPTYQTWANMLQRCTNPKNPRYADYGGRGVLVCVRWWSFENFLADMGEQPTGLSVERQDNSKGYEPGNCIWADDVVQQSNTRKNVYFEGRTVSEWARILGRTPNTISWRLKTYSTVHLP